MMKAEKLNEEKLDCLNEAKKVIIIEDYEQQIKDMDFHFQYLIFSMPAAKSQTHQDFLPAKIKKGKKTEHDEYERNSQMAYISFLFGKH